MVILAGPGVARDPASIRVFQHRMVRIGMCGVVVDGTHDNAARPRCDARERRAFQFAGFIARFHVFHLAMFLADDPSGEDLQFAEVADRSDAAKVESGDAGVVLDAGCEIGGQSLEIEAKARTGARFFSGYHFPALLRARYSWAQRTVPYDV